MTSKRRQRGVTPVELAISVTGIALLAVGGGFFFSSTRAQADSDQAVTSAQRVLSAAEDWQGTEGARGCPTLSQLQHERFLPQEATVEDPWGNRFKIQCSAQDVQVRSAGPDGKTNTEDDVRVPNARARS
jgi:type II secretory pathway pseudopilin PulG